MQALVIAHQDDAQALSGSFQDSVTQIEEVGKALLIYKGGLMEQAKAEHDRAQEDMQQDFNEEYNVMNAMMQSKIQELRIALAECHAHDQNLNAERAEVGLH